MGRFDRFMAAVFGTNGHRNGHLRESALDMADTFVNPIERYYDDPTGTRWLPVAGNWRDSVTPYTLPQIRERCRLLAERDGYAINVLETRVSYVVGKGHTYEAAAMNRAEVDDDTLDAVQDTLDEWMKTERWWMRQQEAWRRLDRDGEVFLRVFTTNDTIKVRFIEPEAVVTPKGLENDPQWSFGIQTDPDDVETALAYCVNGEIVPADEIQHRKANVDGNVKRGLPLLWAVSENHSSGDKTLKNTSKLAEIQSSIAMVRKHAEGVSKSSIESMISGNADVSVKNQATGKTSYARMYPRGAVVDTSADIDCPASHVSADGIINVHKHILRSIAARSGLAEHMVSADASNANYASTLAAEGPVVKMFERLQRCQIEWDLDILWRVVRLAIEQGKLPADIEQTVEIQAEAPTLAVRDRQSEANADLVYVDMKAVSVQTIRQKLGVDNDQEEQNLADWARLHPAPTMQPGQPPGLSGQDSQPPDFQQQAEAVFEAFRNIYGREVSDG